MAHMARAATPNAIAPAVRAMAPVTVVAVPATGTLSVEASAMALTPTQYALTLSPSLAAPLYLLSEVVLYVVAYFGWYHV